MKQYIHTEKIHNVKAPDRIIPHIIRLLEPKSVVDIGCGLGTFLHAFKNHGVTDIFGVDGHWVDRKLLSKYLKSKEFMEWDLETELKLDKRFDLVINLEVAEHLSSKAAGIHVKNLVNSGKVILFSAAIPGQGGQNHVNEQWPSYWEKLFSVHGYVFQDVIRPLIWADLDIEWWYRQNTFLITPKGFKFSAETVPNSLQNVVHPQLFNLKKEQLKQEKKRLKTLLEGKAEKKLYLKLLLKSFIK